MDTKEIETELEKQTLLLEEIRDLLRETKANLTPIKGTITHPDLTVEQARSLATEINRVMRDPRS